MLSKAELKRPFLKLLLSAVGSLPRMATPSIETREVRRILVFQDGGIGDVLRVLPLVAVLRRAFPEKEIFLLRSQRPDVSCLMPRNPEQCTHLLFDMSRGYGSKLRDIAELRKYGFDLLINPSRGDGVLECGTVGLLMGIPIRVGFDSQGSGFLYTHSIPFNEEESILSQNASLLGFLGIHEPVTNIGLKLSPEDQAFGEEVVEQHSGGAPVICAHVWASSHPEFRRWGMDEYVALFRHLAEVHQCRILLLGSPGEIPEAKVLAERVSHSRITDLTGRTSLAQTAGIIRSSNGFIGNDSSLLHIANAWHVPALAFFGATSPEQVLPLSHRCTTIRSPKSIPCRPCYRHQPLFAYRCDNAFDCLRSLELDYVLKQTDLWLNGILMEMAGTSSGHSAQPNVASNLGSNLN